MPTSFSFQALATTWWLKIYDVIDRDYLNQVFQELKDLSIEFEQNYSRFVGSSYISRLNRDKIISDFPLELFEMLSFAQEIYAKSLGNFNIGVGAILEDLGYDSNYSFSSKPQIPNLNLIANPFLALNQDQIKICPETRIDLGGLGKGWLIDKIANFLLENDLKYFSLNGGGDIYSTSDHHVPLEFVLENPNDITQAIGKIKIQNQGLAGSSANRRFWLDKKTGAISHHLINLKENLPENQKLAVFTSAKNALLADVASTTIFLAEPSEIEIIAKDLEVEFLIIWSDLSFVQSKGYAGILFD